METNIINQILKGYIEAALWTEEERLKEEIPNDELIYGDDDESDELEKIIRLSSNLNKKKFNEFTRDDIEDNSLIKAYTDIKEFISNVGEENILVAINDDKVDANRIGMDLWLSRNGHGSGFFDGHYDYDREKIFMYGSKKMGTVDFYINDEMKLSFSNEHIFENKMKIIITENQLKKIIINHNDDKIKINGISIYKDLINIDENKNIGYNLLINECKKFKSAEELLKSGGFSNFALDLSAFGFTEESVNVLSPKNIKIKWKGDLENVLYEVKNSKLTPIEWSKKINITEPVDVSFNGKYFYLEDGHHRYYAAKTLKKKLKVKLEIVANPIKPLSNKDYDQFHIDFFNKNILSEQSRNDYIRWKRKNVTLRGMKDRYSENNSGARFGSGLYTAFLSNKKMGKEYGKVYFVLNAIPKNPKVFNDTNMAEIFLQGLVNNWCKYHNIPYDPNEFFKVTDIRTEMLKLGYDGLVVKGREMVNYLPPDNVKYFETERQLEMYYDDFIVNNI